MTKVHRNHFFGALDRRLLWVLAAVGLMHLCGLTWGLPSSIGWDNDGVAPRDFLFGVVLTYTPGRFYTYPPVHLLLLTLLTLPAWSLALWRAPSLAQADVVAEFIKIPYMTTFSLVARLLTVLMSLGIVWAIYELGRELRSREAGLFAAIVVGLNTLFNYYAHTSNLDVPYLFWACLAVLCFARTLLRKEARHLRLAALFAALAVGTKDQAYALFLYSVPATLLLWFWHDPWPRNHARHLAREGALAVAIGAFTLLTVDGALFNPSGFVARLRFLTGSASQDHAYYAKTFFGKIAVLVDAILHFSNYFPAAFGVLALAGFILTWRSSPATDRAAHLLPAALVGSFTLGFNMVAGRTEDRFLLPQSVFLSIYVGFALERLWFAETWPLDTRSARLSRYLLGKGVRRVVSCALLLLALHQCLSVNVALAADPRYEAEHYLRQHTRPSELVEIYGNDTYQLRLPPTAQAIRLGPEPLDERSALPGVREVQGNYADVEQRKPDWIVVVDGWAWRYLKEPGAPSGFGRTLTPAQAAIERDTSARGYFRRLLAGQEHYDLVFVSAFSSTFWPRQDIHASTARPVWILKRKGTHATP